MLPLLNYLLLKFLELVEVGELELSLDEFGIHNFGKFRNSGVPINMMYKRG